MGAPPIDRAKSDPASRWTILDTIALITITLVAAALRLVSLGRPVELVFDEIFYARDACWYVLGTEQACGITDLVSRAHPPLGKWLIGAGIAVFGFEPHEWLCWYGAPTVGRLFSA